MSSGSDDALHNRTRAVTVDSGGEDGEPIPSTVSRINPGEVDFMRWVTSVSLCLPLH